jgi:hypothetical protein
MRDFRFAAALVLALCGAPARADDNAACAKFESPLAYNACLAKLGPPASATRGIPEAVGGHRSAAPVFAAQRTKGRVRMEFTITPR